MSDFLQGLIARSRAHSDTVRPRMASIFEPAAIIPQLEEIPGEQLEETAAGEPAGEMRPRPRLRERMGPPETVPVQQPVSTRSSAEPAVEAPRITRTTAAAEETRLAIHKSVALPASADPPRLAPPAVEAPVLHQTREVREVFDHRQTLVERTVRELPATPPRHQSAPRLNAAEDQTASEPVIHVSIGRVEVRAVIESPAARQERKPSPVMGLEEYLRGRANGAGR
jgi:hypothetical protein